MIRCMVYNTTVRLVLGFGRGSVVCGLRCLFSKNVGHFLSLNSLLYDLKRLDRYLMDTFGYSTSNTIKDI